MTLPSPIWPACTRAPRGYYCTRPLFHPGPCAARERWWLRLLNRVSR